MSTLYYVHDPMCSWCYGFSQTWQQLQQALPDTIQVRRLLGGLAPDTDALMPEPMQRKIRNTWQQISHHIPGIEFNFDFWETNQPRRATYPACRAVIAARTQGEHYNQVMTEAIQKAYYLQARNPSDESTLIELAVEIGLDDKAFSHALKATETQAQLQSEIKQSRAMHADSFPNLVLEHKNNLTPIAIDYNDYRTMLEVIEMVLPG